MSSALKVALVGAGPAAANYSRVIRESSRAKLDVVIDDDLERAEVLADQAGCVMATDVQAAEGCNGAIITTSPSTHADLASRLIEAGIHVLVETPLATEIGAAKALIDLAASQDVGLMCGFVERFNPVVRTARMFVDETPRHIVAIRHSPPNPRTTTNVIHDLMIHDIDLAIQFGGGQFVDRLTGHTWVSPDTGLIELADASITFPNGTIATFSASRISHKEIRNLILVTSNKMVEVDLLRQHVSVTRHVNHDHLLEGGIPTYRATTIVDSPFVRHAGEPLALQLDQFLDLAEGRLDKAAIRQGLLPPHTHAYRVEQS